ncbi:MAG: FUSC family protein [Halioglobus sp.]|nr:FUSC family protein [Halioglobus sp.]
MPTSTTQASPTDPVAHAAPPSAAADAASQRTARLQFACKTALALTLAYLVPLSQGWPQPQTAAMTVLIIAATGTASESLNKGVLRIIGTLAGAVIGLGLIALFPQERMLYLLAVSLVVTVLIYLYNAYQGDSTALMLTAVVTLMVFNGGDAEGAFLYGADRAFLTAFGVIAYTLVASLLWPPQTASNARRLAADALARGDDAFTLLSAGHTAGDDATRGRLRALLDAGGVFRQHYLKARGDAEEFARYRAEWQQIAACLDSLEDTLVPALQRDAAARDCAAYILNHAELLVDIQHRFSHALHTLDGGDYHALPAAPAVALAPGALAGTDPLTTAALAAHVELVERLQATLDDLQRALDSRMHDTRRGALTRRPAAQPAFIWCDAEYLKTAARAFLTFWLATGVWILFNPPGGFLFVTMCVVFVPLLSFTPITPRLLMLLLTLGFTFALPAYVFLLPQMTHWLELATFLFCYAFLGFMLFPGPVALFFVLGVFTLNIQNSMHYQMDALLLIMLMFYLACALLLVTTNIPFSSRPERVYRNLLRHFFRHSALLLQRDDGAGRWLRAQRWMSAGLGRSLLSRMALWAARVMPNPADPALPERLALLNRRCGMLFAQIHALRSRAAEFAANPLVREAERQTPGGGLADCCAALAKGDASDECVALTARLGHIEQRLNHFLATAGAADYHGRTLAQFYVYLALQASILQALQGVQDAQSAIDPGLLTQTRFHG